MTLPTREDVIRTARSYIETPFVHRGRLPGIALDCIGVPVCVSRELGIKPPDFDVEPYTRMPDGRTFLAVCDKHMTRVAQSALQPGDVVVFAVGALPQHIGVIGNYLYGGHSIIHANMRADPPRVVESRLMYSRILKFIAGYVLIPSVEDLF
jgi:cell wall-associated NlpC family hydrolase